MKNSVFLSAIMLLGIVTIGYANDQKFDFDTATGFNSRKQLKIALHNPPDNFVLLSKRLLILPSRLYL